MECPTCHALIPEEQDTCLNCQVNRPTSIEEPFENKPFLYGRFSVQKRIGVGGYGNVYIAQDRVGRRQCALKILHLSHAFTPEIVSRFRRECIVTHQLQHPAAVRVYSHFQEGERPPWMAMELLRGKTLSEYIDDHKFFSALEVLEIFRPICELLSEAHQHGVVHRDLKPRNIFLIQSSEGRLLPKVLDFGIASWHGDNELHTLSAQGVPPGTPKYMSPEHWHGLRHADTRSDIYSLALIAYQLLSWGHFPFEASEWSGWMMAHCQKEPRPLRDWMYARSLNPKTEEVIMRALEKDPSTRHPNIAAFWAELSDALSESTTHRPISSNTPSSPDDTMPEMPRNETPAIPFLAVSRKEPAKLHVMTPPLEQTVAIDREALTIGRSPDNDLVLAHDTVSRSHAKIIVQPDGLYCIIDQTGRGLDINGTRYPMMYLRDQDRIFLGNICLRFTAPRG
jgi:serine/threonine protein kinase